MRGVIFIAFSVIVAIAFAPKTMGAQLNAGDVLEIRFSTTSPVCPSGACDVLLVSANESGGFNATNVTAKIFNGSDILGTYLNAVCCAPSFESPSVSPADYETRVQHGAGRFYAWFQQTPRPGFTKATVSAWRVSLEDRKLGSSSIIIRMSAIREPEAEAADNGLLAPKLAAGIARVKSVKSTGIRVGNWLSQRQAQTLLNAPDISTVRGLMHDRRGENHQAYSWQYGKPGGEMAFDFCLGRGREGPRKFLGKWEGILQTDGYAAYDGIGGPKLVHVGC
jgi:hypothetical protein